jgi:hypothetical protein
LPHYCFSCGILGHSSIECKNPGERDVDGKLPYSKDRLCVLDEKKMKTQGARSSSGSVSAGQGGSSTPTKERSTQPVSQSGAGEKQHRPDEPEASSLAMQKTVHAHAKQSKTSKGSGKDKGIA